MLKRSYWRSYFDSLGRPSSINTVQKTIKKMSVNNRGHTAVINNKLSKVASDGKKR